MHFKMKELRKGKEWNVKTMAEKWEKGNIIKKEKRRINKEMERKAKES